MILTGHNMRRAAAGAGGVSGLTAKSFVVDVADTHNTIAAMGIRSIELMFEGSPIALVGADYTAYGLGGANGLPTFAFDTSLDKINSFVNNSWYYSAAGAGTDNRIIAVFDSVQIFDGVRINNFHESGVITARGANNTKITISPNTITDTTYNAAVSGGVVIFNDVFPEHPAGNNVQDYNLPLI